MDDQIFKCSITLVMSLIYNLNLYYELKEQFCFYNADQYTLEVYAMAFKAELSYFLSIDIVSYSNCQYF